MTWKAINMLRGLYVRAPDRVVVSWVKSRLPNGIFILKGILTRVPEVQTRQPC